MAERVYSNVRTIWVEPTSGIIVNGQEQERQVLRARDTGTEGVTLLEGTLAFDDDTVAAGLARAADANSRDQPADRSGCRSGSASSAWLALLGGGAAGAPAAGAEPAPATGPARRRAAARAVR